MPSWIAAGLIVVILINLGLVGWIYLSQGEEEPQIAATPADKITQDVPTTDKPAPTEPPTTETPAEPQAAAQPAPAATRPAASTASPARETAEPAPARVVATPLPLSELPASERILYDGFSYSTHIYTDDPSLCAIVVNGQRLTAGDSFQGLKVIAITEVGVVFEENRRGQRRQIEVSVLEQWDSE